jgi:spermidine synthase/MFS family permease
MSWFFVFFLLSGFCSLVYQVTWLRVAMAAFGVTTPSISIVLSVFMAGIALGSWGGGSLLRRVGEGSPRVLLGLYAATESWIGIGGLAVAPLLVVGRDLLASDAGATWGSTTYYLASGAFVALVMLPFCTAMGATFPLGMAAIRALRREQASRSFSHLYAANLLGAMLGALGSAFVLIELLGFRGTMRLAAALNALVAVLAVVASRLLRASPVLARALPSEPAPESESTTEEQRAPTQEQVWERPVVAVLAVTGLSSLGMEIVWTRQFLPFQGPVVYTFATILAVYLGASTLGTVLYRLASRRLAPASRGEAWRGLTLAAAAAGLAPLLAADPRWQLPPGLLTGALRLAVGVGPFCAILGFLTPWLMDRISGGDARRAGTAYAVNTVGCIVGPLVAGFVALPLLGERGSLVALAAPLFLLSFWPTRPANALAAPRRSSWLATGALAAGAAGAALVFLTQDVQTRRAAGSQLRRDHTATVIASGRGFQKRLEVNGTVITRLTPITKMMTHLPLALLSHEPRKGIVLCLGMGTSFRSMLAWGIDATVVELIPSVPTLLPYFHADFSSLLQSPEAHVVVDDARRFLERSDQSFDVIVIDPPPPVAAAASSLLYSAEFYEIVARRLAPGGILQQWLPGDEPIVIAAAAKALASRFPFIRVFASMEGRGGGLHFLASEQPIPERTPAEAAERMPPAAKADLIEWGPQTSAEAQLASVLTRQRSFQRLIDRAPDAPMLTDDRPVNEYYLIRQGW